MRGWWTANWATIRIRQFDGADTWRYLDET